MNSSSPARSYYSSLNLAGKFNDIDKADHFDHYRRKLSSPETNNFVLDFGNNDAWCGLNLDQDDLSALMRTTVRFAHINYSFLFINSQVLESGDGFS